MDICSSAKHLPLRKKSIKCLTHRVKKRECATVLAFSGIKGRTICIPPKLQDCKEYGIGLA